MRSHTFKLAARFGLATLTQGLLVLGVTTLAAAQDGAELPPPLLQSPAPGQAQAMDSPSDRPFEGGPAADTWANPAVDSYGSCSGCNACGSSYGGCGYGGYDSCGGYGSCGGCADCDAGCGLLDKIVGHFAPSDRCFSNFVAPITNSVFFEDPRTLTQARFLFLNHELPAALGGGDVQVYALQLRAAINDRLSVIAIKDGFIVGQPSSPADDGWADIGIGFKYLLWADCCRQQLLAGGVTFELPTGSQRSLQGNGDGEFNIFLSGGARLFDGLNWLATGGVRIPTNHNEESQVFYFSNHLSRRLGCSNFYMVGETNWYHWLRSGNQTALAGVEGLDFFNFGSTGVAGNDIVTGAWGLRYKPNYGTEIGIAYEVPLTSREDIIDNRFTFDWIFRY